VNPVDLSVADIRWQLIAAEWSEIAPCVSQWRDWRAYRKTTIALSNGTIDDLYDLPTQRWVPNAPIVICRISNSDISAAGHDHPIHISFWVMFFGVGESNGAISGSTKPNPRWRPRHEMTWHDWRYQEASDVACCQITLALCLKHCSM